MMDMKKIEKLWEPFRCKNLQSSLEHLQTTIDTIVPIGTSDDALFVYIPGDKASVAKAQEFIQGLHKYYKKDLENIFEANFIICLENDNYLRFTQISLLNKIANPQ